jgi:hypothetical protein
MSLFGRRTTRRRAAGDRPAQVLAINHDRDAVSSRTRRIYDSVLKQSAAVREGNFTTVGADDLRTLFDLYDFLFFSGLLSGFLRQDGASPVMFRLSDRMTRAAGKTFLVRRRVRSVFGPRVHSEYEIAVSTLLLFQTFDDTNRTVTVGGVVCRDRLEALQRIFEHELLHLTEFLAWGRSSCAEDNFRLLSRRIFAHEGVSHDLVTPREVAAKAYDIRVGDRVGFSLGGKRLLGLVNRITKRATVLVEDPLGRAYSDGKSYATYYVPLDDLRKYDAIP